MYVVYNANPEHNRVGDCVVRAISKATEKSWEETYLALCVQGLLLHDMPTSNHVWGDYLEEQGWVRQWIDKRNQTVRDFVADHPKGRYILAISGHVVAVVDGCYFDTWDSGEELPVYYWEKERTNV